MPMPQHNAFYAQSGGVTAVINASAAGVIETARQHPAHIGTVYAGRHGILGALTEELIDTSQESAAALARLTHTPGGAFGSARYQLPRFEDNRAPYDRLLEVFQAHQIRYFFYNGGGDSADTCLKIAQVSAHLGCPIIAVHVPKTVDNDLPHTDCCPGFGSAAKYVATSIREAAFDVAAMARTSTRVFLLEVMGRHAGWLTAACGLAAAQDGEAPHLLLFPEIPFTEAPWLARVEAAVQQHGSCVIGVSEGLRHPDGTFVATVGGRDAFGHTHLGGVAPVLAQCLRATLQLPCHWAVLDYLQRAARHLASQTDVQQAYAVGQAAVEFAVQGHSAVMPTIVRVSDQPYTWTIGMTPLEEVANQEKPLPRAFISADGFHITPACRTYLTPLIQGEAYPPFKDGLPEYVTLTNRAVPKKLPSDFTL
jgi:ATP-dependent phosphofructokinase / diphosphate-dependent phosphofructokinase